MVYDVVFPITDGLIVTTLRDALAPAWASGLTVQAKLPDAKTARMVTVRNDSGPQEGVQSRRRYGVNVWASSAVDAEKIALDAMAALRRVPPPVTATDSFSGPFEVEDDPQLTVGNKNLTHFYFTFRASVRGSNY